MAATPDWMRAQKEVTLPTYDDKTSAVILYSEKVLTVNGSGKMRIRSRVAYKILRPAGESQGRVVIPFDDQTKVLSVRGWSIPAVGKDFEVKERDVLESAVLGVSNGELMSDAKSKLMRIPGATVGSIVGYEFEQEYRPYMRTDEWGYQDIVPVRQAHYRLELPTGWSYKASWINGGEIQPVVVNGAIQWTANDVKAVRVEDMMPPWRGIAAKMYVSIVPPNGQATLQDWHEVGAWYAGLARDRTVSTPEIKQRVAELTAQSATTLAKIEALAKFVQSDIRYVAIEIGIGGFQPRHADFVFKNRYGDCKDKVTLLSTMLREIGVESHPVLINTVRGSISAKTPPNLGFNHVIIGISVPTESDNSKLLSSSAHPKLGKLVYFDPTDETMPFGRVRGELQSNYGLLIASDTSELFELPKLAPSENAIDRTAQMSLDASGHLTGDVVEVWTGDRGMWQRDVQRAATQHADRIKILEQALGNSLSGFAINKASIRNERQTDKPFEWHYNITAQSYARAAGDLLIVRPRIIGIKSSGVFETKESRSHPIEFTRPERHNDVFEIAIPDGYEVESLPPAVHLDHGFIAYQSKNELVGRSIRYTRTYEIRELSVPAEKAETLKVFYRAVGGDERNVAVLKKIGT